RLSAVPGVRAASLSWLALFGGSDLWLAMIDVNRPDSREQARVDYDSSRYFDTVGMRLLRGRDFAADDREGAPRVAIDNETFARPRAASDRVRVRRARAVARLRGTLRHAGVRRGPAPARDRRAPGARRATPDRAANGAG